ncbi:MAG TPA: NADH-quinone oxidoreductase subunit L [Acidimicrobiia bacterium]|nr:NADH-quinone oxidoreductase subunit L [Acidimicrobiia bacterium]
MSSRELLDLAWIVPALPLLGAVVLLFFGRRIGEPVAGWIATGLMALAFVWSIVMFAALRDLPEHAQVNVHVLFTWLPAGLLHVDFGVYTDPLSVTWLLLVTGVGTLIHLYSIGYMHGDARFSRFFCYLNLFAASMLILVLGSTFLLTFLGWEGVGLSSYLLVSFWFERNAAAVAGKKAFVTNRVGDVGFLLAMFLIFASYGTLDYAAMPTGARLIGGGTATAIALLLLLAAVGKSAQFPLHVWLPDAMEGPTPVSALIHAATMVTAGVFLLCRAHPFLEASPDAATVVAWIGGATALLAGTVAILQPDIKRVLAYSTVSQLGYMFLAVGVGAYSAAVFMVICHACYKGCLFLGAGSVIHGNHDGQDMRVMGGFRRFLPYTAMGMTVAWLAIAGIPPLSGFFSKDEIITQVYLDHDYGLWIIALVAAVFTGLYMTRLIFLTFYGNERFELSAAGASPDALPVVSGGADDHVAGTEEEADSDPSPTVSYGEAVQYAAHPQAPHESPGTMTGPILMLAFLAAVIGFINMPFDGLDFFDQWLEPSFPHVPEHEPSSFFQGATLEVLAVILAIVGITLAYRMYRRGLEDPARDPLNERLGAVAPVLGQAYYYDYGISRLVDGPLRAFARFLDRVVDHRIIDGTVDGVGKLVKSAARGLRHVQDGLVRRYALGIALGAAALLLYALVWVGR